MSISYILYTLKVKILASACGTFGQKGVLEYSQVTNAFNSLLGTSEAICLLNKKTTPAKPSQSYTPRSNLLNCYSFTRYYSCFTKKKLTPLAPANFFFFKKVGFTSVACNKINKSTATKELKFKQWLAGLIDGAGCFTYSKKGSAGLEVTMDIRDERALQSIKNVYGGSVKIRSNANALRYRLHHKEGLINLINDINGHLRNSNRLVQLNKICIKYGLALISPEKLTYENGWLSGFFDADGTISINRTNLQLSISLSQKTSEILIPLIELYGGQVYIDRGKYKSFKWYISKKEEVLNLIEYFKKHPSRSKKCNRLHLTPKFYLFKNIKAQHALPGTLLAKS